MELLECSNLLDQSIGLVICHSAKYLLVENMYTQKRPSAKAALKLR